MTDYAISVLLGIIEGLTEFLPVSSTAHLRIAEALLQVDLTDPFWKMFTIVIQLGAVLCLPIYFADRLRVLASRHPNGPPGGDGRSPGVLSHPLSLVLIAFVVTVVPTFFLAPLIGQQLESLRVMGASLVVGGIVMWIVDVTHERTHRVAVPRLEMMSWRQAVWIGACQVLSAVFPGTSRSMATISGGQLAGMSRPAALEFSFLLSFPTMMAAAAHDLLMSLRGTGPSSLVTSGIDPRGWALLTIGFVVSFVVAYATVAWFMTWVRQRRFVPFAIYRIVIGLLVLGL